MQPLLLNISCKGGSLRVTPDGLLTHASMTGKPVWQIPARGVSVVEVSRKVMATIEIRTPQGSKLVEWVSPTDIPKLQQALAQAQTMPFYPPNPYASSAPTYPSYPYQSPPQPYQPSQQPGSFAQQRSPQPRPTSQAGNWWQRRSKRAKIWIAIIVSVFVLGLCGNMMNAVSQSGSAASNPTPTQASNNNVVAVLPTDTPTDTPVPTHTPKPTPKPTPTSVPAQPTPTSAPAHTGVNGNPWGYDFNPGNKIYNPPADFCSYFACITTFWNGHGYVDQCVDGDYSKSGGLSGACSHHGGEAQPLYSH